MHGKLLLQTRAGIVQARQFHRYAVVTEAGTDGIVAKLRQHGLTGGYGLSLPVGAKVAAPLTVPEARRRNAVILMGAVSLLLPLFGASLVTAARREDVTSG